MDEGVDGLTSEWWRCGLCLHVLQADVLILDCVRPWNNLICPLLCVLFLSLWSHTLFLRCSWTWAPGSTPILIANGNVLSSSSLLRLCHLGMRPLVLKTILPPSPFEVSPLSWGHMSQGPGISQGPEVQRLSFLSFNLICHFPPRAPLPFSL